MEYYQKVIIIIIAGVLFFYILRLKDFILPFIIFTVIGALVWNSIATPLENDLNYLSPVLKFYQETNPSTVTDSQLTQLLQLPNGLSISQINRINLLCLFGFSGYIQDSYEIGYYDEKGYEHIVKLWGSQAKQMPKSRAKVVSIIKPWFLQMAKNRNIDIYENIGGGSDLALSPSFSQKKPEKLNFEDIVATAEKTAQGDGIKITKAPNGEIIIDVLFGKNRVITQLELNKDSLVVRENNSFWQTAKSLIFGSGIPTVLRIYDKSDILNIITKGQDIAVSTNTEIPEIIISVLDKSQRETINQLFNAWLYSDR
ncbi:MAG: hypothetical protein NT155_00145 [Candidatus Staskawiczbacteria bacterium]|nr:hypothetical protein [Candidatus Staskawiczbacteria bacterium]